MLKKCLSAFRMMLISVESNDLESKSFINFVVKHLEIINSKSDDINFCKANMKHAVTFCAHKYIEFQREIMGNTIDSYVTGLNPHVDGTVEHQEFSSEIITDTEHMVKAMIVTEDMFYIINNI